MVENIIIYTVEVIKYYIIMKYLLGFRIRRSIPFGVAGAVVIGMFAAYITMTEDNPLLMFLVYIYFEMFILIKERASTIILSTLWLMIIVGMLDNMFLVLMEFLTYNIGIEYSVLDCIGAVITAVFLWIVVIALRKWTKGKIVRIAKVYYIYLSALTFAEGVLVVAMKEVTGQEYGTNMFILIFVCTVVMILNIIMVLFLAVSKDGYKQRDALNRKYLKMQEENYLYIKEKNEDTRRFRHDIKGHMSVMKELIEKDDIEKMKAYIDRVEEELHLYDKRVSVSNGVVDAILNKSLYEAEKYNVDIKVKGQLFEDCCIEPYDLCVIFDNILKNAIEAAAETLDKKVYLRIGREEGYMKIYIENSCIGERYQEGERFVTTKYDRENHGYGLENIYDSVKKYNGTMSLHMENNKFFVDIYVPISK